MGTGQLIVLVFVSYFPAPLSTSFFYLPSSIFPLSNALMTKATGPGVVITLTEPVAFAQRA